MIQGRDRLRLCFAFLLTLAAHLFLVFLPDLPDRTPVALDSDMITVRLTNEPGKYMAVDPLPEERPSPSTAPAPSPNPDPAPAPIQAEIPSEPATTATPGMVVSRPDPEVPQPVNDALLSRSILASQFLPERKVSEPAIFTLSGRPSTTLQADFQYPVRKNMYDLMVPTLPDLPFAYTPGFVKFSYEPGFLGEIQRSWDAITPEYEFRTKNGTLVKCKLILIIAGCVW
jgi:hypothetical protein